MTHRQSCDLLITPLSSVSPHLFRFSFFHPFFLPLCPHIFSFSLPLFQLSFYHSIAFIRISWLSFFLSPFLSLLISSLFITISFSTSLFFNPSAYLSTSLPP